jgi:hypothetical protein
MAQTGFTPIQLYSSSTPTNAPSAGNLTNDTKGSELAVNIADGKLFYKDTSNNVQTLADKTWIGTVTSVSGTSPVAVATGTSTPVVSLSAGYGDTQNPYASKTANNFLAAPNGSPGAPTFRAIVAADIPTLNQNTTGSAATLTTARNLWGQSFNGSADISAPLYPAAGTVSAPAYSVTSDTNTGIFFPAADTIAFAEGGAESMRIDSSGNLGLGTTPSPWGANWRGFEFGARGALSYNGGGGNLFLTLNAYSDGTNFIYKANAAATQYAQSAGAHLFSTAASGTAGNPITFTQVMQTFASGGVSIGNTTDPGATNLSVTGSIAFANVANGIAVTGTFTRDSNAASGNVAYTGVGFKPSLIVFYAGIATTRDFMIGGGTAAAGRTLYDNFENTLGVNNQAVAFYYRRDFGGGNFSIQSATIASMNADGFTLAYTRTVGGAGASNSIVVNYIAYK